MERKETTASGSVKASTPPEKRKVRDDARIKKRSVIRPHTKPSDLYVSARSAPAGQLKRAKRLLLEEKLPTITLHGLGAVAPKAVSLALSIKEALHNRVTLRTTTSSVLLIDDVVPHDDDLDLETQTRCNSAVHIEISMMEPKVT